LKCGLHEAGASTNGDLDSLPADLRAALQAEMACRAPKMARQRPSAPPSL
jgi:hypothetical protein